MTSLPLHGRTLLDHRFEHGQLFLKTTDGEALVTLFSADALEVQFREDATGSPPSYAIGAQPAAVAADMRDDGDRLILETSGLVVDVRKDPLSLSFSYKGQPLVRERGGFFRHPSGSGFEFELSPDEKIFGGGSRALGKMDRRGERLVLYNSSCYRYEHDARQMYYSMPAIVSSRKYMLVFDNGARGHVDIDSSGDGTLRFDAVGGRMAYLVVAGDSWHDFADHLAGLTGRQPLLPRWALGHISSRMGYKSQEEVLSLAKLHLSEDIPLDAVVLDLFWFGPSLFGSMGNLDWDRNTFPDAEKMMADLTTQGVNTVLITEPMILTESANWTNAVARRVLAKNDEGEPYTVPSFFGAAGIVDVFDPAAREWFWEFYRKHTATGVAGWWGDLGEPETHPDDILHASGRGVDVHNVFGHEWARLVYEGLTEDFPAMRPFNLMRAGFVGTQRYGILPWSGDVSRTWGGLRAQVEIALQMGLQGVAYMHSDLGGFTGNQRDQELYIRWLQYGVFQPIYRPHGHDEVPPEPVFWDEETRRIVRRYIKLRYRLMPYNYTLMFENASAGLPLMRPLMFADSNPALLGEWRHYLWGDSILVSPVLEPEVSTQTVTFPAGAAWYDFHNGKRFPGGRTQEVPVTLEDIPVFVRAGVFIPMIDSIQNMAGYDPAKIQIHFFADPDTAESTGQFYDDDGKSPGALREKKFELLWFRSQRDPDGKLELRVNGVSHDYPGRPAQRTLEFHIHGLNKKPADVRLSSGDSLAFSWDNHARILRAPVIWTGAELTLAIHSRKTKN